MVGSKLVYIVLAFALLMNSFQVHASIFKGCLRALGLISTPMLEMDYNREHARIVDTLMNGQPEESTPIAFQPDTVMTAAQEKSYAQERAELVKSGFDLADATPTDLQVYGAHTAAGRLIPASLRPNGAPGDVFAPADLKLINIEHRAVEHYFFRASQVEPTSLRQAFSRVVRFGAGGTGILVSDQGHIVTARHVLENARRQNQPQAESIYLGSRETPMMAWYQIEIPETFKDLDLAVIHAPEFKGAAAFDIVDATAQPNDTVFAIGYPQQLSQLVPVLSVGRVFSPRHSVEKFDSNTEARSGNSGGPLVNIDGQLVGMIFHGGMSAYSTNTTTISSKKILEVLRAIGIKR